MKIIQAMKEIKANKQKIADLQSKIANNCANLSNETPQYGAETKDKINSWLQSCYDLSQRNIKLLCDIQRTNLATQVPIELGGKTVTKSIAEWVWRRREYAAVDSATTGMLTDRKLKDGVISTSTGNIEVKVVRHFDPVMRDNNLDVFRSEVFAIDSTLEIINATTDLIET